jgi:hypothetical protein
MRIPSGVTDQYVYFVAVDATDLKTREAGLSSFTVYRSRNGGAAAAMTTPTVNETDGSNMPGVYELLLDEDMTIDSGDDSQEMVFHITHGSMAPITRTIELYRPKITAGNTLDVSSGGNAGIDLDNIQLTNGAPALGRIASGTLSGTHSTTTADLGANAPSLSMVGKWLRIPTRDVSAYVSAHNTGTGVVTFSPATAATLTDGDQWYLEDSPYLPTDVALMPKANVEAWNGTAVATPTVAGVPEVDLTHVAGATTSVSVLATNVATNTTKLAFLPAATAGASGGLLIAGSNAATTVNITGNITGNLSGSVGSVSGAVGSVTGAVGSVTGNVGGNVTGSVGSVVGAVGSVTGNVGGNVTGTVASVVGNIGGNVTGSVGSVVGAVGSVTGLTAADVGAIKTKTDQLTFGVANTLNANITYVNETAVTGTGAEGDEWGP